MQPEKMSNVPADKIRCFKQLGRCKGQVKISKSKCNGDKYKHLQVHHANVTRASTGRGDEAGGLIHGGAGGGGKGYW